jgi:hypothetical protein
MRVRGIREASKAVEHMVGSGPVDVDPNPHVTVARER